MSQPSIADSFITVITRIHTLKNGVDNDHPQRYAIHNTQQAAYDILQHAIYEAHNLCDICVDIKHAQEANK
jgi:hypothetical protein